MSFEEIAGVVRYGDFAVLDPQVVSAERADGSLP
jgi:hypothetical protein